MSQIIEYLKAIEQKNSDLKIKIQEPGFWRQCVISHLNWKYKHLGPDRVHRAIYEFLGLEDYMDEYLVALYFPSIIRYVDDNKEGWQYCKKPKAYRFLNQESAQSFIETLDAIHRPIAKVEKI